jgi:hypothetical protein
MNSGIVISLIITLKKLSWQTGSHPASGPGLKKIAGRPDDRELLILTQKPAIANRSFANGPL